jgi:hypothetical protein
MAEMSAVHLEKSDPLRPVQTHLSRKIFSLDKAGAMLYKITYYTETDEAEIKTVLALYREPGQMRAGLNAGC